MFKHIKKGNLPKVLSFMGKKLPLYLITTLIKSVITAFFLNVVLAIISKEVFDAAINKDIALIKRAIVIALISFLIGACIGPILSYISNKCTRNTMTKLQLKLFCHLCDCKVKNLEEYHSGDLVSRVANDVQNIENIYLTQIPNILFTIVIGLIAMSTIFVLEWHMGLLVLILGIITIIITKKFALSTRKVSDIIQKNSGKLNERLIDIIKSFPIAKIFGIGNTIHNLYAKKNDEMSKNMFNRDCINARFSVINIFFSYFNVVGLFTFGIFLSIKGYTSISTVIAIILLQGNANYMFSNINNTIIDMQKSLSCVGRVIEILNIPVEQNENNKLTISDCKNLSIELKDVCFSYKQNSIIKNINISVNGGKTAGIIGKNGCGKSTIAKLLLRFYDVNSGEILISDKNINNYKLSSLRDMIAYVPQNAYLFNATIKENISYGKPYATDNEIFDVAKKANAHDFITKLPQGYDTIVLEGGENLSGGQKQRISIARAMLKNAPILLLDEATSALDSESEKLVQDAINTLVKDKTAIVIAHKLLAIKNADMIYELRDEKVEQSSCYGDYIKGVEILNSL